MSIPCMSISQWHRQNFGSKKTRSARMYSSKTFGKEIFQNKTIYKTFARKFKKKHYQKLFKNKI